MISNISSPSQAAFSYIPAVLTDSSLGTSLASCLLFPCRSSNTSTCSREYSQGKSQIWESTESLWACLQLWVSPLLSLAPQPWAPVATVESSNSVPPPKKKKNTNIENSHS